jgi:hypothetical protein
VPLDGVNVAVEVIVRTLATVAFSAPVDIEAPIVRFE